MSDKFREYLTEQIKARDFNSLLKDGLNDKQKKVLVSDSRDINNLADEVMLHLKGNPEDKDYANALSTVYEIYQMIDSMIRDLNQKAE